ncbi:MAG TPA: MBL fold metallo-hydrolase [Longimicrobiaceae bacterium]|nr:MBL fold metallo-hydrolase [Longimicrobiaceae bacterium]
MEITFLGATGTVTGSKTLVTTGSRTVLVDCGLFQGLKQLRLRNRQPFPVDPASIDAVVLTHAHLDHSGYLPLLVREGFRGPVYCTPATHDLCGILLPDSGHLQEEEAEFANRHGHSKHHPALPLYTQQDAVECLESFRAVPFGEEIDLGGDLSARLLPAGHIQGAAMALLRGDGTSILFTGDLGRPHDPLLPPPAIVREAEYLVLESTYGDRLHEAADPVEQLGSIIRRTSRRGGVVLIPAFAVGRTQMLLYLLYRLEAAGRIPGLPIFVDSPMAASAIEIFGRHPEEHRLSPAECRAVCGVARAVESVEESKAIDRMRAPRVIISASGMATGGRVLHHLKAFAPEPRNSIVFVGHQAMGTRGAAMLGGARSVKIHGQYVPVRAEVAVLDNLSAHADAAEILDWMHHFEEPPRETFLVHGEPQASDALRLRIEETLGWTVRVPEYRERVVLGDVPAAAPPVGHAAAAAPE